MSKQFSQTVSRMKTAIRKHVKTNGAVSAVDIANISRSSSGEERGAVVRRAFADLVEEGFIRPTKTTTYNTSTHHSVTVYQRVTKKSSR